MIRVGTLPNFDAGQVSQGLRRAEFSGPAFRAAGRRSDLPPFTHPAVSDRAPLPSSARRKLLLDAGIVAALVALGGAGYLLAPLLTPRTDVVLPQSACDLGAGPCTIELPGGGRVEVAIEPRPIPALKPLRLTAVASGAEVARVEVDFTGVDMNMGYNRPRLDSLGDGRFAGQGSLPVCITGRMPWAATFIVETRRSVVAAPFRFDAGD